MIKYTAFLCFSFIFFSHAQNRHTLIGLEFNIGGIQIRENALNSLVHKGPLLVAALSFVNESQTGLSHTLKFSYGSGSLKSRFENDNNTKYWNPKFRYSLTTPIINNIAAGGYLSIDYQVMEFENWDDSHIYWLTSYETGPLLKIENIPIDGLIAYFRLPLFAIVSRSRNKITNKIDSGEFSDIFNLIHSDKTFVSFIEFMMFDIHVRYTLIQSSRMNLYLKSNIIFSNSVISDTKKFSASAFTVGFLASYKFH